MCLPSASTTATPPSSVPSTKGTLLSTATLHGPESAAFDTDADPLAFAEGDALASDGSPRLSPHAVSPTTPRTIKTVIFTRRSLARPRRRDNASPRGRAAAHTTCATGRTVCTADQAVCAA